ncbi:MAG: hypothetical protein ACJ741_21020 [Pyrinomonadaceae bacterium]
MSGKGAGTGVRGGRRSVVGRARLLAALFAAANALSPSGLVGGASRASAPRSGLAAPAAYQAADPCAGRLAFDSLRDFNGNGEIYSMSGDGGSQTRLTAHSAIDLSPAWSPDGQTLAFRSDRDNLANGRSDIYLMNPDGTNVRRLTTHPGFDESPAWSPDGKKIAFLSTRDDPQDNNVRNIYLMNADGSAQTRLTAGSSVQPEIAWSPDGTRIAFARSGAVTDTYDLFTVAVADGSVTRLTAAATPGEHYVMPAWSPDGTRLALSVFFFGFRVPADIYVMNSDGTGLTNLTRAPGNDTSPAWAPDGGAIAFVSDRDGNREIYLMYPDGSGQTNLTRNAGQDDRPAWQPPPSSSPPCLLTEPGTERAAALHSVAFTRDPFTVLTARNLSLDRRTRVALFCRNVRLLAGEDASVVTARAEDSQHRLFPLAVEFVGKLPNFEWLTQVNVLLPAELEGAGDVRVSVSVRGAESNGALVSVASGIDQQ